MGQQSTISRDTSTVADIPATVLSKLGLQASDPEAGVHAHGLNRKEGRTLNDGPHIHLFILPDGIA